MQVILECSIKLLTVNEISASVGAENLTCSQAASVARRQVDFWSKATLGSLLKGRLTQSTVCFQLPGVAWSLSGDTSQDPVWGSVRLNIKVS